ncbi:hypothetical protein [Kaarinaea lacus]
MEGGYAVVPFFVPVGSYRFKGSFPYLPSATGSGEPACPHLLTLVQNSIQNCREFISKPNNSRIKRK